MKLEGQIKVIKDTIQVSDKFSKREFVLTVQDGNYSNDILIQLVNNNCSLLDKIQVNQNVECEINIKGKGWQNPQGEMKYFTTLECWKIQVI